MKELLANLMDAAASRSDYADARLVRSRAERLSTRNGEVDEVEQHESAGIGVRVRCGGGWGFAATRRLDRTGAERALERALEVAAAQPAVPPLPRTSEPVERGSWASAAEIDPFAVPLDRKLETLLAADAGMSGESGVAIRRAHFLAFSDERRFVSTEGADCDQRTTECGGGITALAVADEETHVRSYPASFRGDVAQAGYEHFASLDLAANAPRVADEAVRLLSAPACPAQRTTVILDGQQLALQLHESVGHAIELDRVLGTEASYAGTSFLSPADRGSRRYGSELMAVTADATARGGLGSFAWDDEGVAARRTEIVTGGVLRDFLSSRETAAAIGLDRSGGCMRAEGFARQPLVRMTNVNLEPGEAGSLDELIAATERGLLLETNRSWSIDSRRLNFQFATELAWEIVDGRRGRLFRNPSYAGTTPSFWAALDAV